jgi:hypothetical protein
MSPPVTGGGAPGGGNKRIALGKARCNAAHYHTSPGEHPLANGRMADAKKHGASLRSPHAMYLTLQLRQS